MAYLLGIVAGGCFGALVAMRRRGNRLDIAQYAGVGAMLGLIVSLVLRVVLLG